MVGLPSQLPLLQVGAYTSSYEENWVEDSLRQAAAEAGHDDWWFAADIARSLMMYLRDRFPGTSITLDEMTGKLRTTLHKIGFNEIGNHVQLRVNALDVSLRDLALESEGMEMLFYALLETRMRELFELGVTRVVLTDMRGAVKHLLNARGWTRSCQEMEASVARFVSYKLTTGNCEVHLLD